MPIKKLADYFARPLVLPFLWALLASSVVCTALYIWVYGVNIPFWDEWIVIDMIRRHCDGLYKWPQIWGQHNEHRLVWPKIFFLSEYCLLGNHYPKAGMADAPCGHAISMPVISCSVWNLPPMKRSLVSILVSSNAVPTSNLSKKTG